MKIQTIQWLEPQPVKLSPDLLEAASGDRILAEALSRRGIRSKTQAVSFLDARKYQPAPPSELPGLKETVERLAAAVRHGEHIGIWGDFDVDGQTATAILFFALQSLGANVSFYIPVRAHESHGIDLASLKAFLDKGVQLLLTCDTGISAHDAVDYAASRGVDCLITDHHTLPTILPAALAVVNPQVLPNEHPLHGLCGAGCAYKVAEGLFQYYDRAEEAVQILDLAAIGTIADLALLAGDNRWLVQTGLDRIRRKPRPAIQAMLDLTDINYAQLSEEHISYMLAPRLNALGRLADANPAVPFLLSTDIEQARPLATAMEAANNQRKLLCDQVFQAAQSQIEQDPGLLSEPALILSHANWPSGVIGIAASRLVEAFNRPVILISAPPDGTARASARSVEGINITTVLAESQDLLMAFGGHAMAAGFSIEPQKIPALKIAINRSLQNNRPENQPAQQIEIDAYLPLERLTMDLVETLDRLSPYGPGNRPLVLATRNLVLRSFSPIGKNEEHLQLIVEDPAGASRKIIWWQGAGFALPDDRFDLAYSVRASNYRGERTIQIEWLHARPIEDETSIRGRFIGVQALDFRGVPDPVSDLKSIKEQGTFIIWQEGQKIHGIAGADRYHLSNAETLVLWNIPPGLSELNLILETVQPTRVTFFGLPSADDRLPGFLTFLAGLIRFAINKRQGQVTVKDLAGATAQREMTVRRGIAWWIAHGDISQVSTDGNQYNLRQGGSPDQAALVKVEMELDNLLRETNAFRSYFSRANINQLLE